MVSAGEARTGVDAITVYIKAITRLCSRTFYGSATSTCPREGDNQSIVPYIVRVYQLPRCVSWPSPARSPSRWPIANYILAFRTLHVPQGRPVFCASPRARAAANGARLLQWTLLIPLRAFCATPTTLPPLTARGGATSSSRTFISPPIRAPFPQQGGLLKSSL